LDFFELPSMPCKGTRPQAVVRQFYLCPLNTEHRHTHKILIHYLPRLICKHILFEKLLYNLPNISLTIKWENSTKLLNKKHVLKTYYYFYYRFIYW
jgi:hypothetical protein